MNGYQQEILDLKAKIAGLEKVNLELMRRVRNLESVSAVNDSNENLKQATKDAIDLWAAHKRRASTPYPNRTFKQDRI